MSEDVQAHIRTYMKVGGALAVLTVITVAVSYIDFWGVPFAVFVALVIAATKGSLVVSFFMHLIEEKKMIYAALVLTVVFFIALIFLPAARARGSARRVLHAAERQRPGRGAGGRALG